MRYANQARPGRDEPDQRSLRNQKKHRTTAHLRFPQEVVHAVRTCGSSITTRLETHYGVLQKATEDLLQSLTDGKKIRSTGNLSLPIPGRTHGLHTWITLYISVSTTMRRNRKERDMNLLYLRSVDENRQASPPSQRPGYRKARRN